MTNQQITVCTTTSAPVERVWQAILDCLSRYLKGVGT
jgi:hypothetical protein